jgi:TetR/AcrR family transcriptional repressor of mexJK operon
MEKQTESRLEQLVSQPNETQSRPSEEARQKLIHEAALNAFVKEGYAGASMAAIARAVGGSKTTLYSRYPSKKELFLDVVRLKLDRLFARISRFTEAGRGVEKALHSYCIDFAKLAQSEDAKSLYRLIISESRRMPEIQEDYRTRVDQYLETLGAAIEAAMRNGQFPPLDWHGAARLLFDLNMNFLHEQLQDRGPAQDASAAREKHAKYVMGILLPAMTAAPEGDR